MEFGYEKALKKTQCTEIYLSRGVGGWIKEIFKFVSISKLSPKGTENFVN